MTILTAESQQHRIRVGWLLKSALGRIQRLDACASICRAALARYDPGDGLVTALAYAGQADGLLDSYQLPVAAMPGLASLALGVGVSVVHDIPVYGRDSAPHVSALRLAGFRSSLTMAVPGVDGLAGFLSLNSKIPDTFSPEVQQRLEPLMQDLTGHLQRELTR